MNSCSPVANTSFNETFSSRVMTLRRALPPIGFADRVETAHDIVVARDERARHFRLEDEQIGDQPRLHAFAIDPMIGGMRRDGAQDLSLIHI